MLAKHKKVLKRKGSPKLSHLSGYVGVFLLIVTLVALGYQPPKRIDSGVANAAPVASQLDETVVKPSVDEIVAASIAGDLAERANLPIAPHVAELSVSLAVKNELAQNDETTIVKPQIVDSASSSRAIRTYTTKAGDTAQSVAAQYNISPTTLKWANNLTSDALDVNKQLKILPIDGVLYTARAGDTADSIAQRYSINKASLVSFNDLEFGGLTAGRQLILPSASLPETERPGYVAPSTNYTNYATAYTGGTSYRANLAQSVGNRYAWGWCTWYAYERRAAMGRPIGSFWGNATSWASSASGAGFLVDGNPTAGAVFQNGGGWGHVGIIDSVDLVNGTVTYSDMNGLAGWGRVGTATTTISDARARWRFIH